MVCYYVCACVAWDQALFSFRFENYIPAGKVKRKESLISGYTPILAAAVRENVWEPLKFGPDLRLARETAVLANSFSNQSFFGFPIKMERKETQYGFHVLLHIWNPDFKN